MLAALSFALISGCDKQPSGSGSGRTQNCTLTIAGEKKIPNPTAADIREAVLAMDTKTGGAFLVIEGSPMTYVQTSGDQRLGFEMEYQEANIRRHYRAKRRFTTDEIVKVLTSYTTGADDWKKAAEWELLNW